MMSDRVVYDMAVFVVGGTRIVGCTAALHSIRLFVCENRYAVFEAGRSVGGRSAETPTQ